MMAFYVANSISFYFLANVDYIIYDIAAITIRRPELGKDLYSLSINILYELDLPAFLLIVILINIEKFDPDIKTSIKISKRYYSIVKVHSHIYSRILDEDHSLWFNTSLNVG